jgi:hypothetical protein
MGDSPQRERHHFYRFCGIMILPGLENPRCPSDTEIPTNAPITSENRANTAAQIIGKAILGRLIGACMIVTL